ncbi:DUF899 family protein [Microbacterium sp. ASV81]|uniref:DUF899 family protein n=1 Tax=Microbacterium capsulatum TaxID=3041921 RepID=A0ABU0XIE8_9MICO|nr:DUF899 family protein [Microbacterium sp. ASV81]MDQ4214898.1 DUF899 family protein [Microbacterium sp. ASV81]
MTALPPVVDEQTWREELAKLRIREKAATRELDAIAAARRRLPAVKLPDYTLIDEDGSRVRLADVFQGRSQLVTYHHMWSNGNRWQCSGCTGLTAQWVRPDFVGQFDATFAVITNGPMDEVLAYKKRVGNVLTWYSSAESPFGADMDSGPDEGFGFNVFLRDGDDVYRTWHTNGRGAEAFSFTFAVSNVLPYGRQEEWQDVPDGWPQQPTYSRWLGSQEIAATYGDPEA